MYSKGLFAASVASAMLAASVIVSSGAAAGVEVAQAASAASVQVSVDAKCENGNAVVRITNSGNEWPGAGKLQIVRMDDRKVVSNRSMRMASGQQASFRVPLKDAASAEFEVSVNPSWYERGHVVDGKIACK